MILYHGSLERITAPEIREPNRTLDYGAGFYATTSFEQAEEWVRRRMRERLGRQRIRERVCIEHKIAGSPELPVLRIAD